MSTAVPDRTPARLVGVDLARTLAVVGMVVAHLSARDPQQPFGSLGWIPDGRASALFAVLAGVSIALLSGGRTPLDGRDLARARIAVTVRAVLIYLLGLALVPLPSGLSVILPAYGAMFVLAVPLLHLRARQLVPWAAGWVLVAPWLSAPLRAWVADPTSTVHRLPDHGGWMATTERLVLTGPYPVIVWFGYLLVGLAVGRFDLRRPAVQRGLALGGAIIGLLAWAVSRLATSLDVVQDRLLATWRQDPVVDVVALDRAARAGLHGQAPPDWSWQLTAYPHASTLLDLLHTSGTAVATIGLCLVAVRMAPQATTAWRVAGAIGATSLTCYALHVLLRSTLTTLGRHGTEVLAVHLVLLAAVATALRCLGLRGPLETLVSRASTGSAELLTRR